MKYDFAFGENAILKRAQRKSEFRCNNVFRAFVLTAVQLENADSQRYVEGNTVNNVSNFFETFGHALSIFPQNFSKLSSLK